MSLSEFISNARQTLKTETPSEVHLKEISALWTEAHQYALRGVLNAIREEAEAEIHAAAVSAQAAMMARIQRAEATARSAAAATVAQASLSDNLPVTEGPIPFPKSTIVASPSTSSQAPTANQVVESPLQEEHADSNQTVEAKDNATDRMVLDSNSNPKGEGSVKTMPTLSPSAGSAKSVNARYAGLKVGLNDRVAFVKHLFNGEDDDFQRVVAALATMESKEECETFLENAVYPDYDWTQKPEFAERFLALVFARFE